MTVNSGQSVRAIKGDKRPIIPEGERAEVLAVLQCVDFVVIFVEPDPLNIISSLKHNTFVKGGDWGEDVIIDREIVESIGGKVVRIIKIKGAFFSLKT